MAGFLLLSSLVVDGHHPAESHSLKLKKLPPETSRTAAADEAGQIESDRVDPRSDSEQRPGDDGLTLSGSATPQVSGRLPSEFSPQSFPCLLIDDGPRKPEHVRAAPGARRLPAKMNFDPNGTLPPNALSAKRHRQLERFLSMGDTRQLGAEIQGAAARGVGAPADTVRILVLRVEFEEDTPGGRSSGNGRFDLRDSTDIQFDPPPHDKKFFSRHMDALKRYYESQLQGALVLEYDIYPEENDAAYVLDDTFKYGPWIFSNSNPDVLQHAIDLVGDSLVEADEEDGDVIDFSLYESFVIFHAGPDFQGDINRDSPWDIPSFNLGVVEPFVVQDSVEIGFVMVVPETVSQDRFEGALNGVVTHEFGHQLGFFDLYDVRVGLPVVGAYSLMDSGDNLFALVEDEDNPGINRAIRGTLPSSIDPFHKTIWFPEACDLVDVGERLGGEGTQVSATLETVQLDNDIVQVPLNISEYLLLENRFLDLNGDSTVIVRQDPETGVILGPEPDSTALADSLAYLEYDWLIPGEGLIAWHVDFLAINTGLSQAGGGLNIFFSRPGVAVVEADGIRDIGTSSSEFLGGPYDPFFKGGYDLLGEDTIPSSETNDGTRTGINMVVLDSIGMSMRVNVNSFLSPGGWPVRVAANAFDNQCAVVTLDDEETGPAFIFPAVDTSIGPILAQMRSIGEEVTTFAFLPDTMEAGLAASENFLGKEGRAPIVAATTDFRVNVFNRLGLTEVVWPIGDPVTQVLSTPVIADSLILVGCSDGRIRALGTRGDEPVEAVFETGGSDGIVALGCGRPAPGEPWTVFWASDEGRAGAFDLNNPSSRSWTSTLRPGVAAHSLLAVPDEQNELSFYFVWQDGAIDHTDVSGESSEGWPYLMDEDPVGFPIVGELDGDGELEFFILDVAGTLHSVSAQGTSDIGWPRSVWSEDDTQLLEQRAGPRILDHDGDGVPHLFVHRGDGFLLALNEEGENAEGFPLSFGGLGFHGPHFLPSTVDASPRLAVGNLDFTDSDTGLTVESLSAIRARLALDRNPGLFARPGFDIERSSVYPTSQLPKAQVATEDLADLRLYPNPLRGDALTVRFVVDTSRDLEFEAFDLDGRSVASTRLRGRPGAAGNQLEWDLSDLASGLYHVRIRVPELGFERFERIAIVR